MSHAYLLGATGDGVELITLTGITADVYKRQVYGHRTTLDDDQRVIAGWLWAGPASALTGGWGLVRHGLALAARPVLRRFVVADPCHSRVVDDAEVLHVHHAPTFRNLSGVPVAVSYTHLDVYKRQVAG